MNKKKDFGRRFLYFIMRPLLRVVAWTVYRVRFGKEKRIKGQHLVLCNHSCLIDSVLVSSMFCQPIYFVAASYLVKSKFWGKLLRLLTGIIPIDKAGMDVKAMRAVLKTRDAGRSVGIFPEGNNTISGAPLYFGIGIAKLAKQLKLPVALCNIRGGYFTHPKWALVRREGEITGKVARIITADEVSELPLDELYRIIRETLYVDAYAVQKAENRLYKGEDLASGIEALFFLCSECKGKATIKNLGNGCFECRACGAKMRYNEYGYIEGSRFSTTSDWDNWQIDEVAEFAKSVEPGGLVYKADNYSLIDFTGEEKVVIDQGDFELYTDRVELGNHSIKIEDIRGTALHVINSVLITTNDGKNYGFVNDNPTVPGIHLWYALDALRGVESQNKSGLRLPERFLSKEKG